jgi:hypothetical protein
VEAIVCELVGCNIVPEVAGLGALAHQVANEIAELPLGPGKVLAAMEKRREFAAVVLVGHEGVGFEHSFEPFCGVVLPVADFGEMGEVAGIVTDASPRSDASAAVVSRIASRTSRRCFSMVSFHSFGIDPPYRTPGPRDTMP